MPSSDLGISGMRRYLPWAIAGFLALAVALVFGQTLRFGFLDFDDNIFITASPEVQAGLTAKSIAWAFTNGPLGEWYPASMLSHMLDCQLFGVGPPSSGNIGAAGHHLTNLLLHASTTIVLFFLLRSMTAQRAVPGTDRRLVVAGYLPTAPSGREVASGVRADEGGPERDSIWPSALVATIFAIHPQHVESVAWIAERRDVLSGLFFVLTLAAYVGYVRQGPSLGRYLLVATLLTLGLMSKSMLVTVPPLLLVLDYWPLGRFGQAADLPEKSSGRTKQKFWLLVVEKLPFLALALGDSLMSFHTHSTRQETYRLLPRLANAVVTLVEYLGQFFYPTKLAAFYPLPAAGYSAWQVAGSSMLLAAITIVAFVTRRRMPYLVVGWCWFVGMMIPVLGLVPIATHAMADRYMYLPGIGLAIAVVWPVMRAAQRSPAGRWILVPCASLAVAAMMYVAAVQTTYWHDDMALWRHAEAVTENNGKVHLGLGDGLRHLRRLNEAVDQYRQAAALDPSEPATFNNLGGTLYELGRLDESAAAYAQAIQVDPDHLASRLSIASVLSKLGRPGEAERDLQRAVELAGDSPIPHIYLARLYLETGRPDLALVEREQAAILDPTNAAPRFELGRLRARQGDVEGAIADFQAALRIDPKFVLAHVNLGQLLAARGQTEAAIAQFQRALAINPDQPAVRNSLDALQRSGGSPRR